MAQTFPGSCYCGEVQYKLTLDNPAEDARTSICHCTNCKKFTGGPYGITTKLPRSTYTVTSSPPSLRKHTADNGSGVQLTREFCATCGSGLCEYGANAGANVYVFYGTLGKEGREALKPKGEFFTKLREGWCPEVPGTFQKKEIHQ